MARGRLHRVPKPVTVPKEEVTCASDAKMIHVLGRYFVAASYLRSDVLEAQMTVTCTTMAILRHLIEIGAQHTITCSVLLHAL